MTHADREQKARELLGKHYVCEDCWYSCPLSEDGCCDDRQPKECNCGLDENVRGLVALLADTERATLERVVKDAKQRAYGIGLNEPMRTNHLYAFACDLEQQAKEIPS